MTAKRVLKASALLVFTGLLAGCGDYALFPASTPGVYKGKPDVNDSVDRDQRREQLRRRVWATQGTPGAARAF